MSAVLAVKRAGPLTSIQDSGRFGMLRHGVSAAGPMDQGAYNHSGWLAGGGEGGIEFTVAGVDLQIASGGCRAAMAGGQFVARHNGRVLGWPASVGLEMGDTLSITPGGFGNYGYVRFDQNIVAPKVMGSMATSTRARIGGLDGRALHTGDVVELSGSGTALKVHGQPADRHGAIGIIWGIHADLFSPELRRRFLEAEFTVSSRLDRMGVQLEDSDNVFAGSSRLSLVSDAIVPGDIQILGNGTPIVLMRDHQPTGGYPRLATVITADLDRFAQMRPGSVVVFRSVTVDHAHRLLRRTTK